MMKETKMVEQKHDQGKTIKPESPKGYFMLFGWVYGLGLNPFDIALLGLLGNFGTFEATTGTYQSCRPARETMAALLGCSTSSVDRSLARLVAAGVLTRHTRHLASGGQLPSEYTVRVGAFAPPPGVPVDKNGHSGGGVVSSDEPPVDKNGHSGEGLSPVTRGVVTSDKGGLSPVTRNPEAFDLEPRPKTPLPPVDPSPVACPPARGDGLTDQKPLRGRWPEATALIEKARVELPAFVRLIDPKDDRILSETIAAVLEQGVTRSQIAKTIWEGDLSGAQNPVRVLMYRIERLTAPKTAPKEKDCPLHRGQPALTCRCCRSELLSGQDPYEGREELRPDGWREAYARKS